MKIPEDQDQKRIIIAHSSFGSAPRIQFEGDWPATEVIGELRYWLCYFETKMIQEHLAFEKSNPTSKTVQ